MQVIITLLDALIIKPPGVHAGYQEELQHLSLLPT